MRIENVVKKVETFMKAIALLLIMGVLASADQVQNSLPPQASPKVGGFDYATQIGILILNEEKQPRLEIKNPNLAPNEKIVIVDVDYNGQQTIKRAEIVEKVSGDCSERGVNDKGGACYKLRVVSGNIDQFGAAFVIAKTSAPLPTLKAVSTRTSIRTGRKNISAFAPVWRGSIWPFGQDCLLKENGNGTGFFILVGMLNRIAKTVKGTKCRTNRTLDSGGSCGDKC
jgi:hypothetical protein